VAVVTRKRAKIPTVVLQDQVATKVVKDIADQVHRLQDELLEYAIVTVAIVTPGTSVEVTHGLGRAALGYYPIKKSAACDIYDGIAPAYLSNTRSIWIRGTAAATVTLRIF
jgi:hypothetical protein